MKTSYNILSNVEILFVYDDICLHISVNKIDQIMYRIEVCLLYKIS